MSYEELSRFLDAQNQVYLRALAEIKAGKKETHWMWFVFPQIKGLGSSENANFYAIKNIREATAYLNHPVLGKNLIEISKVVLDIEGKTATDIFGTPDDMKLRSCMTLFAHVENADPVFKAVLKKYFEGVPDSHTMGLLKI